MEDKKITKHNRYYLKHKDDMKQKARVRYLDNTYGCSVEEYDQHMKTGGGKRRLKYLKKAMKLAFNNEE